VIQFGDKKVTLTLNHLATASIFRQHSLIFRGGALPQKVRSFHPPYKGLSVSPTNKFDPHTFQGEKQLGPQPGVKALEHPRFGNNKRNPVNQRTKGRQIISMASAQPSLAVAHVVHLLVI